MNVYPITTLFMLMSVDGKISTGSSDDRDFDKDLPRIDGVSGGLHQYYELEQETDLFSLNTGKVMAKVGWNEDKNDITKLPVSFVVIDNMPHLTAKGVTNLLQRAKKLILVTTNPEHPAATITLPDLRVITYDKEIDFKDLFRRLKTEEGVERLTVQSGGELNAALVRSGLINLVSVVVAPLIVGGRSTPTLIDGDSLVSDEELALLKPLELLEAKPLENSYLHLNYKVL